MTAGYIEQAILCRRSSALTAGRLAQNLGLTRLKEPSQEAVGTLIRWGSNAPLKAKRDLQPREGVALARNKLKALVRMADQGVMVPRFVDEPPAIGRTGWHQGGAGLMICRTQKDIESARGLGMYLLEIVPSIAEYRVHTIGDQGVAWQQKKLREGIEAADPPIRNHKYGWVFAHIRPRGWLTDIGVRACRALGLLFGAVDVILTSDKRLVVLEVNTAPALEGRTLAVWTAVLKGML